MKKPKPKGRYRIYRLTYDHHSDNINEAFDLKETFMRDVNEKRTVPVALVFDTLTQKLMEKP